MNCYTAGFIPQSTIPLSTHPKWGVGILLGERGRGRWESFWRVPNPPASDRIRSLSGTGTLVVLNAAGGEYGASGSLSLLAGEVDVLAVGQFAQGDAGCVCRAPHALLLCHGNALARVDYDSRTAQVVAVLDGKMRVYTPAQFEVVKDEVTLAMPPLAVNWRVRGETERNIAQRSVFIEPIHPISISTPAAAPTELMPVWTYREGLSAGVQLFAPPKGYEATWAYTPLPPCVLVGEEGRGRLAAYWRVPAGSVVEEGRLVAAASACPLLLVSSRNWRGHRSNGEVELLAGEFEVLAAGMAAEGAAGAVAKIPELLLALRSERAVVRVGGRASDVFLVFEDGIMSATGECPPDFPPLVVTGGDSYRAFRRRFPLFTV